MGIGRARNQMRAGAGAAGSDAARICDRVRDERVGGDSRFRNRTGWAYQRGRGGGAAGRAVWIGGGDGPRDESCDRGGRERRNRDGRGARAHARSRRLQSAVRRVSTRYAGDGARGNWDGYSAYASGGGRGGNRSRIAS